MTVAQLPNDAPHELAVQVYTKHFGKPPQEFYNVLVLSDSRYIKHLHLIIAAYSKPQSIRLVNFRKDLLAPPKWIPLEKHSKMNIIENEPVPTPVVAPVQEPVPTPVAAPAPEPEPQPTVVKTVAPAVEPAKAEPETVQDSSENEKTELINQLSAIQKKLAEARKQFDPTMLESLESLQKRAEQVEKSIN